MSLAVALDVPAYRVDLPIFANRGERRRGSLLLKIRSAGKSFYK